MRFGSYFLAVAALATSVVCDGASIKAAMDSVSEKTVSLDTAVVEWNGRLLGVLPVVGKSTDLLFTLHSATKTAEDSANLTLMEATQIAAATQDLAKKVVTALGNIQEAKPKFKKLALTPAILLNLVAQKAATDKFGEATISKVPEMLQEVAKKLLTPIEEAFDKAIEDYKSFK